MAGVLVGRLVKSSVLWLDAITCLAAGEVEVRSSSQQEHYSR